MNCFHYSQVKINNQSLNVKDHLKLQMKARILIQTLLHKFLNSMLIVNHFKMSIDNDNNFKIMSSQQPVINQCICQHEQKKQKKQKNKAKQLKPKPDVEKSQENSDSKTSQKQSKIHSQVNEDIRIFEDKIRLYTSEIDESKKKTLNLPIKWIKKLGTQNKRI
ncbi:unnamed protein product [Paramecium sonneborni]|uniref:Uncharacterized protein n=1 Tax=Paramecium sonneborni TaxID=65129 RepID=A0A8S1NI44_9CILI|nr:unnamed protein product [Paramecium sonneborni]